MRPARLVYATLSSIVYPVFNAKLPAVEGLDYLPSSGGYIIACNHVDWLDGFYIAAAVGRHRGVPVHFLTQSNNYWWTTVAVQIPAARGLIVDSSVPQLQHGQVICNFPEGERNVSSQLLIGKTGTVRMAATAGVPVIPAGIACEVGRNMGQSLRFLFSSRRQVQLKFGAPLTFNVPPGGITAEWLKNETGRLMRAIAPLANKRFS